MTDLSSMRASRDSARRPAQRVRVVTQIVRWYFDRVYGRLEGPGILPFYCDKSRIGEFAASPDAVRRGESGALFKLFVALSMYQARRDVLVMEHQRTMSRRGASVLTSLTTVARRVADNRCPALRSAELFDLTCDVSKINGRVDCHRSTRPCHVKDASVLLRRTGSMGKVATSAWLHIWHRGLTAELDLATAASQCPNTRAEFLVMRFSALFGIGRKLATMYVAALSTPALSPGFAPWHPVIDGNGLVVVDTNVARAIDSIQPSMTNSNYQSRVGWVKACASMIDLSRFCRGLDSYSPRIVQQALYAFTSRSNRVANSDACGSLGHPCAGCPGAPCPFA